MIFASSLTRLCLLAACLASTPSFADFRYVAPGEPEPQPSASPPMDEVPGPASAPLSHAGPVVSSTPSQDMAGPSGTPRGTPLAAGEGDVIQGFAEKVPLVLALREIAPSSYQFAFAPGVKVGRMVSWKGGRPWHDVLNDLLKPLGLAAGESGSVIYVDPAAS